MRAENERVKLVVSVGAVQNCDGKSFNLNESIYISSHKTFEHKHLIHCL